MKVLIVGAGAVGIGYGYHLFQGGAEVSFFVRDKYVHNLKTSPLVVHRLYLLSSSVRREWKEYGVISTEEEVRSGSFDFVMFTAPQNALRQNDFAKTFVSWLGVETTIIATSNGHGDWQLFANEIGVPWTRLVYNKITAILWQAPIPGERTTPVPPATGANKAIGYYAPVSMPFYGALPQAQVIVTTFVKGGLAAHYDAKLLEEGGHGALYPIILGLEASGWSFSTLRKQNASLVSAAAHECAAVSAKLEGKPVPSSLKWTVGPFTLSLAAIFAPLVFPFDLERYMKLHFADKIQEQIKMSVNALVVEAHKSNIPISNLELLLSKIPTFASIVQPAVQQDEGQSSSVAKEQAAVEAQGSTVEDKEQPATVDEEQAPVSEPALAVEE